MASTGSASAHQARRPGGARRCPDRYGGQEQEADFAGSGCGRGRFDWSAGTTSGLGKGKGAHGCAGTDSERDGVATVAAAAVACTSTRWWVSMARYSQRTSRVHGKIRSLPSAFREKSLRRSLESPRPPFTIVAPHSLSLGSGRWNPRLLLVVACILLCASSAAVAGPWHAGCADPRNVSLQVSQFSANSVKGIFCADTAMNLGMKSPLDSDSCPRIGGQWQEKGGYCKFILYFGDLVANGPFFCLGVRSRTSIVWILISEYVGDGSKPIYNYEWKVIGSEHCTLRSTSFSHDIDSDLKHSIVHDQAGAQHTDPAEIRSTASLQRLYMASWNDLFRHAMSAEWNCIVNTADL